jgi:hypothetical protein
VGLNIKDCFKKSATVETVHDENCGNYRFI